MSKTLATRMAFGDELLKIAETNPDFVVCNADTKTCGLEKFGKRFPEREFSFGIAEQDLVGGAAGLAACGNKVFLATFATFASMRACEQVRTFVCYPKLNVSIIGTHTGLQVGGDGATHAAIEDVAILRAFPNMTIVQPADAVAARALAHAAVEFTGPLYIRLHRNPVADVYDPESYRFELGKAHTVLDYGTDLTMIVSGILLKKAIDAAAILREKGIGARVLDMATIKPLDREAVLTAAQEQMSEVVIAVLQKAVVSKAALSSWEVYQILGMDFPALEQVAVCEGAEGLTEGEGVFFGFGVDGLYVDFFGGGRDV